MQIDTGAVLKKNSEALQLAKNEIVPKTKSWNYRDWDEVAWDKVKDVSFREILDKRKELAQKAQHFVSLQCPKFMEHVSPTSRTDSAYAVIDFDSTLCSTMNGFSRRRLRD